MAAPEKEAAKTTEPRFSGYALYTYNANRPGSSAESSEREDSEGTVSELLKREATTNHDFSLSLLSTDLTGEQDTELRTFIAKRLAKGTVYSGSGNVSTVDNVLPGGAACQCYYCLLRGDKETEEDAQDMADIMMLGGYLSKDYVVCFVADSNLELQLFQRELDKYSRALLPELMTPIESLDVKEQFGHLQDWYEENVNCLCRCAALLEDNLAVLTQCGLTRASVKVTSDDAQAEKDINLFIEACTTADATATSYSTKTELPELTNGVDTLLPDHITVTVEKGKCSFSSKATTSFCKEWSKTMLSGDTSDPVFLRQVIENYKLRVNHDMNTLKRLLRQAETDHYALYRSYQFLLQCGNGPILLQNTKLESQAIDANETLDILKVLENYINDNNKFSVSGS